MLINLEGNSRRHYLNQARAIYKYNVCKKISQLNKVIQLFLAQVNENQLNILQIRQNYEKCIDDELKNYEKTIKSLQKESNDLQNEVDTQISQDYLNKIKEIEKKFKEESDSINLSTNAILDDTNKFIQYFNQIKTENISEIDKLMTEYSQFATFHFSELQKQIAEMKDKFSIEINTIDNESNSKINNFQKESQERLKKLIDQHSIELNKIQNEKYIQIGIDPSIKYQMESKKNQVFQLKDEFQRYFNVFYQNLNENKSKFKEQMDLYSFDLCAYEKAKNSLESKYNQADSEMLTEMSQLESNLKQKEIQFDKELNEKQNELSNLIQNLNEDYIEKSNFFKNGVFDSNSSISELMIKLTKEKDDMMSKYQLEKKDKLENTIQTLVNLSQQEENQFITSKKELEDSLQKLKEDHFVEKATNLSNHQEMTENEIKTFSEEMMKLRHSIQSASNSNDSILFTNKQILLNLQNEKDEFSTKFEQEMSRFKKEENEEISELKKKHLDEDDKLKNDQMKQINSFVNEEEELIQRNIDDFNKKKEIILMRYEKEREEYLNKIRLEYLKLAENEIKEVEEEFSSLYKEQSNMLSKIEPPSSSNQFSQLTNEVNDLAIKRSELYRSISIEKNTLIQMYENEISTENFRHERFLDDLKNSGRKVNGRDTLRQTIRMRINEIKKEKEEEKEKFNCLLNQLKNEHQNRLDQLSIELEKEKKMLEEAEIESKDKISIENINCKNEIEFAENNYQKDKFAFHNEILLLNDEYDKKITDFNEKVKELIKNFQFDFDELNNKLKNVNINEIDENDKLKRLHLLNLSSLKNQHQKNVTEMNDMLNEMGASIARSDIQNRNELESNKKENSDSISNTLSQNDDEKKQLIQTKSSLSDFLEERIEVLIKIKEHAKEKYLNRPSRDIEIDKIKKYEKHCSLLNKILKNGLKDITTYRKINAAKEKEYNMMFGRNPSVGVLIVGSSRSNYQYY